MVWVNSLGTYSLGASEASIKRRSGVSRMMLRGNDAPPRYLAAIFTAACCRQGRLLRHAGTGSAPLGKSTTVDWEIRRGRLGSLAR